VPVIIMASILRAQRHLNRASGSRSRGGGATSCLPPRSHLGGLHVAAEVEPQAGARRVESVDSTGTMLAGHIRRMQSAAHPLWARWDGRADKVQRLASGAKGSTISIRSIWALLNLATTLAPAEPGAALHGGSVQGMGSASDKITRLRRSVSGPGARSFARGALCSIIKL
jgi:hypothetical protein